MQRDAIHIEELTVEATIGVPDAERQMPQRLVLSITLVPSDDFRRLDDNLERTVDYAVVASEVESFVRGRTVKLIETLADELARHLLERFPLQEVQIELRKFVLPNAKHVSVRLQRTREAMPPPA